MSLIIKNGKILLEGQLVNKEIEIEDGKIKKIDDYIEVESQEVIDAKGHFISAGFVDVHVHLREPGGEHKKQLKQVQRQQQEADLQQYVQCLIQSLSQIRSTFRSSSQNH